MTNLFHALFSIFFRVAVPFNSLLDGLNLPNLAGFTFVFSVLNGLNSIYTKIMVSDP